MIFDDFQNGIVNALNADPYFAQSPAVLIVPEEPVMESTEEMTTDEAAAARATAAENHRKMVQDALNTNGIVGVVSEVDDEGDDRSPDMTTVSCVVAWFENRKINQADRYGRSARNCAAKARAILWRYRIPVVFAETGERVDTFTPLRFKSNKFIGEEDGIKVREMVFESSIAISTVATSLADENSFDLVDENNATYAVEPTPP